MWGAYKDSQTVARQFKPQATGIRMNDLKFTTAGDYMKIKQMGSVPAGEGVPYTEGYAANVDPKTGVDARDILPNGVELMPVTIHECDYGTTHEGDMGRLGKSE